LDDRNPWVGKAAARALEVLHWRPGDEARLARLLVALEKWDDAASLGAAAGEPLVQTAVRCDDQIRCDAIRCLAAVDAPKAMEAIAMLLRHRNEKVADAADKVLNAAENPASGIQAG